MTTSTTIDRRETEHFGRMAADWWDPRGSSAMLHRLNPVRLGFIRDAVDRHWRGDRESVRPLAGKSAVDVGCGAGLLCEPLARLGAQVTGVDAAPENIAAAQAPSTRAPPTATSTSARRRSRASTSPSSTWTSRCPRAARRAAIR